RGAEEVFWRTVFGTSDTASPLPGSIARCSPMTLSPPCTSCRRARFARSTGSPRPPCAGRRGAKRSSSTATPLRVAPRRTPAATAAIAAALLDERFDVLGFHLSHELSDARRIGWNAGLRLDGPEVRESMKL